jgi:hypothetical protein
MALVFALASPAGAQETATIHGCVVDGSTEEPLISATTRLAGTTIGAATGESGNYSITRIEPGTYTIVVSYLGYRTETAEISLAPGEQRRLDITLFPDEIVGEEVVVTSRREVEEANGLSNARMSLQVVQELPAVLEADLFRSIQLLPGVKAASDFSSGLHIRGGGPDQTLIMLDGTTVYNPTHLFGLFSTFNPDALEDATIHKGAYPAGYGGRLGSVVDLTSKSGNRERTEGRLTIGLLSSRLAAEGPHGRGSWMLALRRSTLEPILPILRENAEGIPDKFYFYDVNGTLTLEASPSDRISLSFYGGADQLDVTPSPDFRQNVGYGNRSGSVQWTHIFSRKLFARHTGTQQWHGRSGDPHDGAPSETAGRLTVRAPESSAISVDPESRGPRGVEGSGGSRNLTPVIDKTYGLDTPMALRHIDAGHARGKVVVAV